MEPREERAGPARAYSELARRRPTRRSSFWGGGSRQRESAACFSRSPRSYDVARGGYVSDDERQRLYVRRRCCDSVVLRGFGIPALEAMTLRVPVVAANRGPCQSLAMRDSSWRLGLVRYRRPMEQ